MNNDDNELEYQASRESEPILERKRSSESEISDFSGCDRPHKESKEKAVQELEN